VSAINESVNTA